MNPPGNKPNLLPWESWLSSLCWICLMGAWFSLFSRIHLWWNEASYYTHGYSVPILTMVLFFRIHRPNRGNKPTNQSSFKFFPLLALAYISSRFIVEPDPFWRLPLWIELLALSACTGLLIRESKICLPTKKLALLTLYLCTCLPWPASLESAVIFGMSQWISAITSELLLICGYPAVQMGTLILVDQQEISINNACSGIRSLQNLISFALFFSLYYRHSLIRSGCCLFFAFCLVVLFNSLRALTLSLVSLEWGDSILNDWHDTIGNFYICASFFCLFFISWFLSGEEDDKRESKRPLNMNSIQLPKVVSISFILTVILAESLVYGWFSVYRKNPFEFDWFVKDGPHVSPLDEGVREVLQFDFGHRQKIELSQGYAADVVYFGYNESSAAASLCSRNHPPDYCMAYAGLSLVETYAPLRAKIGEQTLQFLHYTSRQESFFAKPNLHVFWCSATLDGRIDTFQFKNPTLAEKLVHFLSGKLSFQRQVILISIPGERTMEDAKIQLLNILPKVVVNR